jgi:hypothetical protein
MPAGVGTLDRPAQAGVGGIDGQGFGQVFTAQVGGEEGHGFRFSFGNQA